MPVWGKGKSRTSSSSPRKKEADVRPPPAAAGAATAAVVGEEVSTEEKKEEEVIGYRKSRDTVAAAGHAAGLVPGHPLPLPGFWTSRYPDTVSAARSRRVTFELQRHEHAAEDCRHRHAWSPAVERPRAHPTVSVIFREDYFRSSWHPLPLPPSSSTSSSRSHKPQWKKGELLGRGTSGRVYLGFNSESGLMCAIKEFKYISDDANSKECLWQLKQEITLLSQLSHPNIVQYCGCEVVDDTVSVFLEYVSGRSIHKLIKTYGPLEEPLIRKYTAQILAGLTYLHARNIVHRDIKGANILVTPNGEIKLADFGMAKHLTMEVNDCNLSVDIWSLGCTVIEMANGKPPWSQYEEVLAIFENGNNKDIPAIPEHLSSEGKAFLRLCLQRDPSSRPSAAQLMDHPFVRDQPTIRPQRLNATKDSLHSSSDGSYPTVNTRACEFPLELPSSYKNAGDFDSMRRNMSLHVSPCSSPQRQFKRSNCTCFASPPYQATSAGAANCSPINALYPTRQIYDHSGHWPDSIHPRSPSPYESPKRRSVRL